MRKLIIPSACLALLATTAFAQAPPPAPPVGLAAPAAWGQQADIVGTVKAFTMTPVGDLEGMILTDGTEVHVPPHLSSQLAAAVRPGESVRVLGWRSSVLLHRSYIVDGPARAERRGPGSAPSRHDATPAASGPTGAGSATGDRARAGAAGSARSAR